jgi:hypothetical protein
MENENLPSFLDKNDDSTGESVEATKMWEIASSKLFTAPTKSSREYTDGSSKLLSSCKSMENCQMILMTTNKKKVFSLCHI